MTTHGLFGRGKQCPLMWTELLGLHQAGAGQVAKMKGEGHAQRCVFQAHSFFLLRDSKDIDNDVQEALRDFRQKIVFAMNPPNH